MPRVTGALRAWAAVAHFKVQEHPRVGLTDLTVTGWGVSVETARLSAVRKNTHDFSVDRSRIARKDRFHAILTATERLKMTRLSRAWMLATACILLLSKPVGAGAQAGNFEGDVPARQDPGHDWTDENRLRQDDTHQQHESFAIEADLVLGFGPYPEAAVTRGATPVWKSGTGVAGTNASLLLAASYELRRHLALGVRLPLSVGSVPLADESMRAVTAFGNLELAAESRWVLSESTTLTIGLGAALPTAQGSEKPDIDVTDAVSDYNRFVVNRVAARSRGFEDNALFEVDHFGISAKLALSYTDNQVLAAPFVRVENLVGTRRGLERSYFAEVVFGTFIGYEVSEHFDVGARLWVVAAFEASGVVGEPQFRWHFGPINILLGGIIPFLGALTDPLFGAFRLTFAARL
jgi:hypothetical protein